MNAQASHRMVHFQSSRFGALSVTEDKIIWFVKGIPGFDRLKRFILIDHDQDGVFKWLQSVDDPRVAFLLTDPNQYKPDYSVPLKRGEIEGLEVRDSGNIVTLVMVCASEKDNQVSINLKGPVVFNSENMRAMQCIIDREDYQSHFAIRF